MSRPTIDPLEQRRLLSGAVSVSAIQVAEDSGEAVFDLTLTGPIDNAMTVRFQTQAATARPGQDFLPRAGRASFLPNGPATQQVRVRLRDDAVFEGDEQFTLNVSAPGQDRISATATIIDNESQPTIEIVSAVISQPRRGARVLAMPVKLSNASAQPVTVKFETVDGSASAGSDYRQAAGVVTFRPGQRVQSFRIAVLAGQEAEGDETFSVQYGNASGASLPMSLSQVKISATAVRTSFSAVPILSTPLPLLPQQPDAPPPPLIGYVGEKPAQTPRKPTYTFLGDTLTRVYWQGGDTNYDGIVDSADASFARL